MKLLWKMSIAVAITGALAAALTRIARVVAVQPDEEKRALEVARRAEEGTLTHGTTVLPPSTQFSK